MKLKKKSLKAFWRVIFNLPFFLSDMKKNKWILLKISEINALNGHDIMMRVAFIFSLTVCFKKQCTHTVLCFVTVTVINVTHPFIRISICYIHLSGPRRLESIPSYIEKEGEDNASLLQNLTIKGLYTASAPICKL